MINHHELVLRDSSGKKIGINKKAIRSWILDNLPFHSDLESYVIVHVNTRDKFFSELANQLTTTQIIRWKDQIIAATIYLEKQVDYIHDETAYLCNLRPHHNGEVCPNRAGITLPAQWTPTQLATGKRKSTIRTICHFQNTR